MPAPVRSTLSLAFLLGTFTLATASADCEHYATERTNSEFLQRFVGGVRESNLIGIPEYAPYLESADTADRFLRMLKPRANAERQLRLIERMRTGVEANYTTAAKWKARFARVLTSFKYFRMSDDPAVYAELDLTNRLHRYFQSADPGLVKHLEKRIPDFWRNENRIADAYRAFRLVEGGVFTLEQRAEFERLVAEYRETARRMPRPRLTLQGKITNVRVIHYPLTTYSDYRLEITRLQRLLDKAEFVPAADRAVRLRTAAEVVESAVHDLGTVVEANAYRVQAMATVIDGNRYEDLLSILDQWAAEVRPIALRE